MEANQRILYKRQVSADGLVSINGALYQVPSDFAGQLIMVEPCSVAFYPYHEHPSAAETSSIFPTLRRVAAGIRG